MVESANGTDYYDDGTVINAGVSGVFGEGGWCVLSVFTLQEQVGSVVVLQSVITDRVSHILIALLIIDTMCYI